ncbi:serine palmitoyltransferase [Fomitiporia mediterranea MF3/22]|uniref:serine palmitoyltransferase n=1 Tax=Fomitiporia mediterranea (strain MF3/22) TaxID=694068 RepID=UPI0004408CBC|nr:serine palmitoyltransferase [Fomitiporia mediterranea MF3/22]EJD01815.1 serine palmitoyltransferase [Fomitiporia mediterranea MF3/22]
MDSDPSQSVLVFLSYALSLLEDAFFKIPGSAVVARYVRSSHQNDPGRTVLELILFLFAIRTLLQSRTRNDKNFVKYTEEEIDELVDEWNPEPLAVPLDTTEQSDFDAVPVIQGANGPKPRLLSTGKTVINLASFNFAGLAGNEHIKERAIETLRKYGLGSCSPPGFYGSLDVHTQLERDIADFLGTEDCILYSQDFSTPASVIGAFCKRGDIIVADRGINFALQKGLQISRSTVRWYDHNDLKSLEDVLQGVEKERRKKKLPLTRRFIVTEGIFEFDGALLDLPKVIELKEKYKFRLVVDESFSFGSVGRTGRGLTELYNVPASSVDIIIGSIAKSLCSSGAFCAASRIITEHQRINGTSFVFSAAMPPLLAVAASEGIGILRDSPSVMATLQENVRVIRMVLERVEGIVLTSHSASPTIHITIKPPSASQLLPPPVDIFSPSTNNPGAAGSGKSNPNSPLPINPPKFNAHEEERVLQAIVEECLVQGVMLTRAKHLRGQELVEPRPSIRISVTSALTKKECEKAAGIVKGVIGKVLGKRR